MISFSKITYEGLLATDEIIAKVLKVSEMAQIARSEKRLREYLYLKWKQRSKKAVDKAVQLAIELKSNKEIIEAVNKIMYGWYDDVEKVFIDESNKTFKLAKIAGFKKATGIIDIPLDYTVEPFVEIEKARPKKTKPSVVAALKPSFNVADKQAINALVDHQLFWVGNHYSKNVSDQVAKVVKETMAEAGTSSRAAGKIMSKELEKVLATVKSPVGFMGTDKQYFEALSANTMTVARVHGLMRSFAEVGITKYQINNPIDNRTCETCLYLEGKEFSINEGMDQMHAELSAKTAEQVKEVHPWLTLNQIEEISSSPGYIKGEAGRIDSKALSENGQAFPPYHYRCRCSVDVSVEIKTFEQVLTPMIPPTPTKEAVIPSLTDRIINDLTTAQLISQRRVGDGVNQAMFVDLQTNDGRTVKGVYKSAKYEETMLRDNIKTGTFYKREKAMYEIDQEMEGTKVIPATINREIGNTGVGSVQAFVENADSLNEARSSLHSGYYFATADSNPSIRRTFLLDLIGANDDRHGGNSLWKFIEDASGKKSVEMVAIDNGLTFPNGMPARYLFPISSSEMNLSTQAKFLKLDAASVKQINSLKLKKVAEILKKNDIEKRAAKQTLIRIRALQQNPVIADKANNFYKQESVLKFFENAVASPEEILKNSADELKKIGAIIEKVWGEK